MTNRFQALKAMFAMFAVLAILVLSSVAVAQSSSDGSFSVHHFKNADYSLRPAQIREAENIYHSVCAIVEREFHSGAGVVHPHFTVVIGAERNEVISRLTLDGEIGMKKWDPIMFAQGVVVLAFDSMLTHDVIVQLGNRGLRQSNAAVNVVDLSKR